LEDCLFCKIINKEIKSDIVFENEHLVAIKDISPVSPVHLLIMPKKHISSVMEIDKLDCSEVKEIIIAIKNLAGEMGLDERGFRVVTNMGPGGGQSVDHLHFHLLGRRKFSWPPG